MVERVAGGHADGVRFSTPRLFEKKSNKILNSTSMSTSFMYRFPLLYNLSMFLSFPCLYYSNQMKIVAKIVGKNKKVFDVACGTGLIAGFLDKSCKYRGIDLNERFVKSAIKSGLNIKTANIFDETAYPKSADFIIISHTLHHIHPKEKSLISMAKRHAKAVLVIEGINSTRSSLLWNNFIGKFTKLFELFGDSDGINDNEFIKTALAINTQTRLKKLFSSLGGESRIIPGGIMSIFLKCY